MNMTTSKFATHRSTKSTIPEIVVLKPKITGEDTPPPKKDLSQRLDSQSMVQKIIEKDKKEQKVLKKQLDLQIAIIKDRAEKNEEKRRKALKVVEDHNKDLDRLGVDAFRENIQNIEERMKTFEEEEATFERQKFVNFKNYMSQKEEKL